MAKLTDDGMVGAEQISYCHGVRSSAAGAQECRTVRAMNRSKTTSCWETVGPSLGNEVASRPIDHRRNLPRDWANDLARRAKTCVPAGVAFQIMLSNVLDQIRQASRSRRSLRVVLADSATAVM